MNIFLIWLAAFSGGIAISFVIFWIADLLGCKDKNDDE